MKGLSFCYRSARPVEKFKLQYREPVKLCVFSLEIMLRRNPTRIELKLQDMQEYHDMKKEKENEQTKQRLLSEQCQTPTTSGIHPISQLDNRTVHERIGYDPKPLPQPERAPLH